MGEPLDRAATRASIYVYLEDVAAAYPRALLAAGTSLGEAENEPYPERAAGVKDTFGNSGWISTYTGGNSKKLVAGQIIGELGSGRC